MKNLTNKFLILSSLFILLLLCSLGLTTLPQKTANAKTEEVTATLFSPLSALEYTELNSPKDFCFFDGNVAVIEGQSIVIHFKDGTKKVITDSGLTALKQIKTYKDGLLISSSGPLYAVSLKNYSITPLYYELDGSSYPVSCNYFDLNQNYLVTVYDDQIDCYDINGEKITKVFYKEDANGDEPVAINQNGDVFYVSGETEKTLVKRNTENYSHRDDLNVFQANPSIIIADDQNVYIVSSGTIDRLPVNGGEVTPLTFSDEYKDYDLGYISSTTEISSMTFNGENLFVSCSSLNSIQEFTVSGTNLYFTGYAVASGKTAYNRIKTDATDVDQQGDAISLLDSKKLTVIKNAKVLSYDKENYYTYLFTETVYNRASIGNGTVLLAETNAKKILLIDFNSKEVLFEHVFESGNNLLDVYYQHGNYYVSELKTGTGNDVNVYIISEAEPSVKEPSFTATSEFDVNSVMTVDIYQNVFLSNKDGTKIFKFNKTDDGYEEQTLFISGVTPAKKLATDLNGRLFGITDNAVLYYSLNEEFTVNTNLAGIKSFALSYDEKSVYFLATDDERIYITDLLPNASADKFLIPENFGAKLSSANLDDLKIYSIKENANLFLVQAGESEYFDYLGLYQNHNNEYTLVHTLFYQTANLPATEYSVLLGYDDQNKPIFIVVLTSDLTQKTENIRDAEKDSTFVATDVSLYFIPMITETDDYCIFLNEESLRLKKGTQLFVQKEVDFLNKTFYFVTANVDGEEINGYVPKDFTTFTLYSNPVIEDINQIIENENDHTLRNALVTAIVATSVFITSIFFILRKKKVD